MEDNQWFRAMALQADILHIDPVIILRDGDYDNISIRRAAAKVVAEAREKQHKN